MRSVSRRLDPDIQHNNARYTWQLQEVAQAANASPPALGHFIMVPRLTDWKGITSHEQKRMIDAMAARTDSSKASTEHALGALIEIISDTLSKGDSLTLPGFGTFEVRECGARNGSNPRTGEELKIAASRIPAFKAGGCAESRR